MRSKVVVAGMEVIRVWEMWRRREGYEIMRRRSM